MKQCDPSNVTSDTMLIHVYPVAGTAFMNASIITLWLVGIWLRQCMVSAKHHSGYAKPAHRED